MRSTRRRNLTTALLATMTIPAAPRAHKVDRAGQQMGWVIPLGAGGRTDALARIFAPYLYRYLPGQLAVFTRNVSGGGLSIGTNQSAARPSPASAICGADGLARSLPAGTTCRW